jgi:hypothetical protein
LSPRSGPSITAWLQTEITVGPTDQRSKIGTFNIAPSWTRLINNNSVFTLGAFVRRDDYNYYPSSDPFADLGPPSLQRQSVGQNRTLTNTGLRSDLSYVKGINHIKAGVTYEQTFLNENDTLGIVDPIYNAPCIELYGSQYVAAPGLTDPSHCPGNTYTSKIALPTQTPPERRTRSTRTRLFTRFSIPPSRPTT